MIKIIEGTAKRIEEEAAKLEGYELESLQFTHRSQIRHTNGGAISAHKYSFYVAVFYKEPHVPKMPLMNR